MTDWGTYVSVDPVERVKAGNEWLTEGARKYVKSCGKAVQDGRLSRAVPEHNVLGQIRFLLKWTSLQAGPLRLVPKTMLLPVGVRRHADRLFDYRLEICLAGKAQVVADVGKRFVGVAQQTLLTRARRC